MAGSAPLSREASGCFHCGEPLAAEAVQLQIGQHSRDFCCAGCAAAASWIDAAGLGAYYRMREGEDGPRVQDEGSAGLFQRPALIERLSRATGNGSERELGVRVEGLRCAACSWLVRRVADELPGVEIDQLDGLSGRAVLRYQPEADALPLLAKRLAGLGYPLSPRAGAADQSLLQQQRRRRWLRLAVAALGSMQAMMFAWPLYGFEGGDMPLAVRDFFRWVGLLVTAPVVLYAAWPFFAGAARELSLKRPGMDLPLALAIALAFGGSVAATIAGSQAVYFESVAMFVFFLLLGRHVESSLRERVASRMAGLAEQLPASARRLAADGSEELVGLLELQLDDRIALKPGETVPVDGQVEGDPACVSEAFLSGESRPLQRAPGATVLAGSSVLERPLRLRVTAVGEATALGELERLVGRASAGRAAWTRLADRAAQAFALIVLLAAAATVLLWAGSGPEQSLSATVAVLAAACPCALALALPTALAAATRALAQRQVLLVRAGGLERLASVDAVVFDKTGTLTQAAPEAQLQLLGVASESRTLSIAAALERCSGHPLAQALSSHDDPALLVEQAQEQTGAGVAGRIDGVAYRLGSAAWCGQPDDGDGALWLVADGQPLARVAVRQGLRPDAARTVAALQAMGLPVAVYSGDHPAEVAACAAQLGIEEQAGGMRPADKLARLQALQAAGRHVLMVGDGMNDAPVLAAAHASLALAQGADLARQQADGVLAGGRLLAVVETLRMARAARRTIGQNLFWAASYNAMAVPAAALGWINPWLAALGMSLSSMLVLANALRLLHNSAAGLPADGAADAAPALTEAAR